MTAALWVIGAPRSGTTLIRNLLNLHPDIALCTYESKLVPSLVRAVGPPERLREPSVADEAFRRVRTGRMYYKALEESGATPTDDAIRAALSGSDWPSVIRALLSLWCDKDMAAAQVWGDKTAVYVDAVDVIDAAVPVSRFLHILRDPRDQAVSARSAWGKSLARSADDWARRTQHARSSEAAAQGRYLEVHFEDLVTDPAGVLDSVTDWLDLPRCSWPLDEVPVSDQLGQSRGRRQIDPGMATARRAELSPRAERRIAALAGMVARSAGYDLPAVPTARFTTAHRLGYATIDRAAMARYYVRSWGLKRGLEKLRATAREGTRRIR